MNTFGEAAKIKTLREIETFGPEILMVIPGQVRVTAGRAIQTEQTVTLKPDDAEALRRLSEVRLVSPVSTSSALIRFQEKI